MSLIVFKDERNEEIAIIGNAVVSVENVGNGVSMVCYRVGDNIKSVNVKHPVIEIVNAVNKIMGIWG